MALSTRWVGRERSTAILTGDKAMFDLDRLIADCHEAVVADPSHKGVRELVAHAVSDPAAVVGALGEPRRAEVQRLYSSEELTILNVVWGPRMTIMPHTPGARTISGGGGYPTTAAVSRPPEPNRSASGTLSRWDATSSIR
jgi:hypothetical protein